jgi:ABC-2 type transport system permease protein
MNTHVLRAVFRRNFVSYFASPTGYLFIFLFVTLSTVAGFWVPDFFGNNLANLDQLSFWFPFIMLIYIPTITMGIWADERKQGTDELLLTIPAADFDIVLGKYLAAVGIFSVSLLFSLLCNYLVLNNLASADAGFALAPQLDIGLFAGTYIGYWLVGLAMLAIGVIASFLTSNITIGFVLGVLFNIPLVFLTAADAIFGSAGQQVVLAIKRWSISQRFADFSHGVVTLSGLAYFAAILLVMLYVSMVLIGRRHWFTGSSRWTRACHYAMRTLALVVIALGAVTVFGHHDLRVDVTSERLSSLSPETVELIRNLKVDRPVQIEAFVSPNVPESYVQTRLNLLNMLNELKALGQGKLQVEVHDTERYSTEAALADKRYGIEPRQVTTISHGALSMDHIFLNVAMTCGVQKVPPVFIDRGIPVEYELVRSICTVSQQKRKRVGVLNTDAQLYGSFNMQTMSASPNWPIIDELEKQYDVVKVDPAKPITEKYDVLLAVQPSSLGPQELDNFVAAVESGQPTAIFEDPAPVLAGTVPATSQPRQAPGGGNPMFGGQPPPPKGDIGKLWNLLGIEFAPDQIIWQDYNPYPKASHFPREFVFVGDGCGVKEPFNPRDAVTAGLQQLLFPFPGALSKKNASDLEFTPLARTGEKTGTVRFGDLMQMSPFGRGGGLNPARRQIPTNVSYVLAAHIQGKVTTSPPEDAEKKGDDKKAGKKDEAKKPHQSTVNVVVVADIDTLSQDFFRIREQGDTPEMGINFSFDNVTFVLNALDALSGDNRFIDIRKRRLQHRTLARIEERTREAKQEATNARDQFSKDFDAEEQKEQKVIDDKVAELKKRKNMDIQQMAIEVALMQQSLEQQRQTKLAQLHAEKDQKINKIETDLALKVKQVQDRYKMWAVLLPPIPPLLVAAYVFMTRRRREREGVARSRLR